LWTALSICHRTIAKTNRWIGTKLIELEKRNVLTGNGLHSTYSHTQEGNRRFWEAYDWTQGGEEWTETVRFYRQMDPKGWKDSLIREVMEKHIREGDTVVEIGPGAGRWTEALLMRATRLLAVDISAKCLELCRQRFSERPNIEYFLIKEPHLEFVAPNSVDSIWSYDVFVHINPTDTERYIGEFERILKPGGCAVIHHPGTYAKDIEKQERQGIWRSHVDGRFFRHFVERHKLVMLEQSGTWAHCPGDLISVFRKPDGGAIG
jgi:ubiquinone/menaquinone biosynthesis C-methylase UbiE